jgi:arginase family enzyme
VLGFDVVEVNPFLDPIGLTQTAAAMLILEFLGAIFKSTPPSSSKREKRLK